MSTKAVTTSTRFAYENTFRREMLKHLTPAETKVLVYIMDKTLGWMKDRERISTYEIKDGKGNNQGTGVTRTTIIKCVDGLVRKGIIFIEDTCKKLGTLMVLNLKWVEENVLREPKQAKKQSSKLTLDEFSSTEIGLQKSKNCTTGSIESVPPINKRNKPFNKLDYGRQASESSNFDSDFEEENLKPVAKSTSVADAIEQGKKKHESAVDKKRKRNLEKAHKGQVNVAILESTFVEGLRSTDSSAFVKSWTMKDRGQAKHLMKSLKMPQTVLLEFMFFCGEKWKQIIRTKFQWADGELSNMPNIGFLLKYADTFLYAFNNKDKISDAEAKSSLDGRVARMVESGMSEEEAVEKLEQAREKRGTRTRKRVAPANQIEQFHRHIADTKPVEPSHEPERKSKAFIPEDMEMKPLDLPEMGEWK